MTQMVDSLVAASAAAGTGQEAGGSEWGKEEREWAVPCVAGPRSGVETGSSF